MVGYGFSEGADLHAENLRRDGLRTHFDVVRRADGLRLPVTVNLPGLHNVLNSLAAIAVALEIGISARSHPARARAISRASTGGSRTSPTSNYFDGVAASR